VEELQRTEAPEEDRVYTERTTESTNLDPWGYQRLNRKPCMGRTEVPCIYVSEVQLSLHVGPPKAEARAVHEFVACLCSPIWVVQAGLSGTGYAYSLVMSYI